MKREDGRKADELRKVIMKAGVVPNANGSALVSFGNTTAVAAVYGPKVLHPRRIQLPDRAFLKTIYNMVPFSTKERCRPGPSRRSKEICLVTRQALEPAVFVEEFPKAGIEVYIDVIEANAGTRTVGINAASIALADAGVPMKGLVASVAAGKIGNDYVLDLAGKEEELTACDLPIAYMPEEGKVSLLQMDGDLSAADAKKVMELAIKGCKLLYKKQREALEERWVPKVKK
jgi:exosome complex component RRP41